MDFLIEEMQKSGFTIRIQMRLSTEKNMLKKQLIKDLQIETQQTQLRLDIMLT